MVTKLLNQGWELLRPSDHTTYSTDLPASILSVLSDHQVIPEPYWKDNEDRLHELLEEDFSFSCSFHADPELLSNPLILLRFEGVDTLADLSVNDTFLGTLNNMHRTWEFPVQELLREGENSCRLVFHSAFQAADAAFEKCATRGTEDAWEGFSHIRKAHYMYGWDWGAHLPDAGIFRDVKLIGVDEARIDSVYITQTHADGQVTLHLAPDFLAAPQTPVSSKDTNVRNTIGGQTSYVTGTVSVADQICAADAARLCTLTDLGEGYSYQVTVEAPDQSVLSYGNSPADILIEKPELWWPNGLGAQPLYTVTVKLYHNDVPVDSYSRRIGLRTLTVNTEPDEYGCCFAHEVNGMKVFAMGGDYIPEEHIIPRKRRECTVRLLEDCKLANYNSIRVWGGGYYPDDFFFDLCDELGLVVWEDFMFACSVYELTPEFEANITQEFIDNIKRLRHHASLGLWCGNNEMESFVKDGEWVSKPSEVRDYLFMYERIIPSVLKKYDPQTFYWPSSPSSGGSFDEPQDPNRGDVHYWQVWHGNKPFTEYRQYLFRYLSEFGFQALPSVCTVKEGITDDPKDMNIFSYIMEKHQRNHAANGKIMNYLQQMYRYPYSFSDMVYASQLLQADGIRYGVEHFRRNRGRRMGAVYWQINDCWPVISWSSIDYYGRWKALHYYAKRFFAPLMLSCEEQGWMNVDADFNRQHFDFEKSIRLNVTNETLTDQQVTVRYALRNSRAEILHEASKELTVPALSAVWLDKVCFDDIDLLSQYVSYELLSGDTVVSSGTVIFSLPKYFRYEDPKLRAQIEGDEIVIEADAYAKSVEILNDTEDLVLSDNYFDMNAGTARVKILRGQTDGLTAEALRLRSVYDIG
ncbi:MAG: glycoside hydrolase family 2 protein [Lachnospiraceae bacterium]|nr:glycoside hydrolase family 2 protein [Lachnospiraceae bacterium]